MDGRLVFADSTPARRRAPLSGQRPLTRLLLAILVLSTVLTPATADASYEKTRWGMAIDEVRQQYPGGKAWTDPDGKLQYSLTRDMLGAEGLYSFVFGPAGLENVNLTFLGKANPMLIDDALALSIWQKLTANLTQENGKPLIVRNQPEGWTSWRSKDGDSIRLLLMPTGDGSSVMLTYEPWKHRPKDAGDVHEIGTKKKLRQH